MLQMALLVEEPIRIWRCPLPLPNALRSVNGYVMIGGADVVIIDPGFHDEATQVAWERHLIELGLNWDAITDVVITHYHPDHCGMAGWIQQRTRSKLWMSSKTAKIMQQMWGTSSREGTQGWDQLEMPPKLLNLFTQHGMTLEWRERFDRHFESFQSFVSPLPDFRQVWDLKDGETIRLCGVDWQIMKAEGHASGQRMLWQPDQGWLFCADHVLPDISPNITVLAEDDPQPLDTYLADLRAVRELPVNMAFPGHRGVIRRWSMRIDELLSHHDMRLSQILQLVTNHAPVTAWTLVPLLYNKIVTDQQMRFALAEMIAHLWSLERVGCICSNIDSDGTQRYLAR